MIWNMKQRTMVEIELEREELEKLMYGEDIRDWINVVLDGIDGPVDLHMYCSNPLKKIATEPTEIRLKGQEMPLPEVAYR